MACGNAWCLTNVSTTPILLQQNQRPSGQCIVKLGSGYNYRKKNEKVRIWPTGLSEFEHFGQQRSAIRSALFPSTMILYVVSCCMFCNLKSTSCISNFQISRLLKFPTNILKQGQFRLAFVSIQCLFVKWNTSVEVKIYVWRVQQALQNLKHDCRTSWMSICIKYFLVWTTRKQMNQKFLIKTSTLKLCTFE